MMNVRSIGCPRPSCGAHPNESCVQWTPPVMGADRRWYIVPPHPERFDALFDIINETTQEQAQDYLT